MEHGAYEQMPYEEMTEEEYERMSKGLTPLNMEPPMNGSGKGGVVAVNEEVPDKFCDNDSCAI